MHLLGNNFFFNIDNINNEGLLSINDLRRINDAENPGVITRIN